MMIYFVALLILVGTPIVIVGGLIWLARWLLKRQTGYDMRRDIDNMQVFMARNKELDFLQPANLLDRDFGGSERYGKGKAATTAHYDRIVDQEWKAAESASQRLKVNDPLPDMPETKSATLGELLNDRHQSK